MADRPAGILVDTNVLSSGQTLTGNAAVSEWIGANAHRIRISVITIAEIRRGLVQRTRKLDAVADRRVRRREQSKLDAKVAWYRELRTRFADRIEPIDAEVAERWADVSVHFPSLRDGDKVILGTALVRAYGIASRNVRDFRNTGVTVVDPFDPGTWDD